MKKILVIGATGLLGSHIVKSLAGKVEVISAAHKSTPYKVDISQPTSLRQLFEAVGKVDGIISTAGMVRFIPWKETTDDDWLHGCANKMMGQINIIRYGADFVRPGGAITLTTGVLTHEPVPTSCIATAVNSAVEGAVRAYPVEMGDQPRINIVSPGWIRETMIAAGMDPTFGLTATEVASCFVEHCEAGATGTVMEIRKDSSGQVKVLVRNA